MNHENLFEQFNNAGKLVLADREVSFADISWTKHPAFEGVELKHIVTSEQTRRTIQLSSCKDCPE